MASEITRKLNAVTLVWITTAILFALCAGYLFNSGNLFWILSVGCAIGCGYMTVRNINRVSKRMRYIVDATVSSDFSYKFPTDNVNKDEREVNEMLNRIVEHLEHLNIEARQNEAFLANVINITDIGLALVDAKGEVRFHNEAALRLLERPALTHICQIPEQAFIDLAIKRSDLTVNEKSFTLFTITDLSRQMQAVEVESWEKLTRVLTHEIMNSLTPIQSMAETMSGKTSDKEVTEALDTISSSSRSLMQFVKNFREFSFLPEPRMSAIYLKPLLGSCLRIAESYADGKNIDIRLNCFPPELMTYTDETLLSRVFINILKNAIEANPTSISIEADVKADETVEIRISNDGELISEKTAEHIFTPFFTTRASGSGIGLSLSRRIITHLGGTLTLKTRPYTCFSIRI